MLHLLYSLHVLLLITFSMILHLAYCHKSVSVVLLSGEMTTLPYRHVQLSDQTTVWMDHTQHTGLLILVTSGLLCTPRKFAVLYPQCWAQYRHRNTRPNKVSVQAPLPVPNSQYK